MTDLVPVTPASLSWSLGADEAETDAAAETVETDGARNDLGVDDPGVDEPRVDEPDDDAADGVGAFVVTAAGEAVAESAAA